MYIDIHLPQHNLTGANNYFDNSSLIGRTAINLNVVRDFGADQRQKKLTWAFIKASRYIRNLWNKKWRTACRRFKH